MERKMSSEEWDRLEKMQQPGRSGRVVQCASHTCILCGRVITESPYSHGRNIQKHMASHEKAASREK